MIPRQSSGTARSPKWQTLWGFLGDVIREPALTWHYFSRGVQALRYHGAAGPFAVLRERLGQGSSASYAQWVGRYDTPPRGPSWRVRSVPQRGVPISLLMHVDESDAERLAATLRSLRDQWSPYWELLLLNPPRGRAESVLREVFAADSRVRVIPIEPQATRAEALNCGLTWAIGSFCAAINPGGLLAPHALYALTVELQRHPEADIVYCDDDEVDEAKGRFNPMFKPDWNPDLLLSFPYLGQLTIYRTALLRELGGWRAERSTVEDWDLALRATERVEPNRIRHVPHVLFHQPTDAAPPPVNDASRFPPLEKGGQGGFSAQPFEIPLNPPFSKGEDDRGFAARDSSKAAGRVPSHPAQSAPLVSVIIPTRNGLELLRPCLESVFHRTDYKNLEVLIVDNRSDDPNTKQYLESMARHDSVRVLSYDAEFNFAAMNNFAARCARGSVLVLLNNDVEAITPDWLTEMVAHAMRREVGAVGAMLYYPNGRIQHAGVVLGLGWVAGHLYRGVAEASIPPRMRWTMSTRTVTAVSAACLVLRTELYQEVGGLDELDLPIAYNDIDLCLRLQRLGYRIVWSARARLLHHESATRGPDRTTGKARRLRRAEAVMRRRWGAQLTYDPAYNPNLTLIFPDCSPAFPPRVKKPWR